MNKEYHFPNNFFWGTSTSSYQVEGHNHNTNWWEWEQNGHVLASVANAADWWGGRWQTDMDLAQQNGQNAHRLSIEWSRIQPSEDSWDEDALEQYSIMLQGMLDRKIMPFVTLHHFTDPLWITKKGGWENPETPKYFAKYVEKVVEKLSKYTKYWFTINEPNVYTYCGYVDGTFPPGKHSLSSAAYVFKNMLLGHALAYHAIHKIQENAFVGIALNYRRIEPARPNSFLDKKIVRMQSQLFNESFTDAIQTGILSLLWKKFSVPEAKNTQDFLGINYYTTDLLRFSLNPLALLGKRFFPKNAKLSENKFLACVPEGLFKALCWAKKYNVPLFVSENGVEDSKDVLRPEYLQEHIKQVYKAIEAGCPVLGYFHWSLVDNFEWERAWSQRFGLYELDLQTQERHPRPSVAIYEKICKENGASL